MNFKYVPILKWKAGEQRTLRELQAMDRRHSLPLFELLPLTSSNVISCGLLYQPAVSS